MILDYPIYRWRGARASSEQLREPSEEKHRDVGQYGTYRRLKIALAPCKRRHEHHEHQPEQCKVWQLVDCDEATCRLLFAVFMIR